MNKDTELTETSRDENQQEIIEKILSTIKATLDSNPDYTETYIDESENLLMAIPLNGNQESLNKYLAIRKLYIDLTKVITWLISEVVKNQSLVNCCFMGTGLDKATWLNDSDDYRTQRLQKTLLPIINTMSKYGIEGYLISNPGRFERIAVETALKANNYLEKAKEWRDDVPENWFPPCLTIITSSGYPAYYNKLVNIAPEQVELLLLSDTSNNEGSCSPFLERMVNLSDIVIEFCGYDSRQEATEENRATSFLSQIQNKIVITFYADWFETDWPDSKGITLSLPDSVRSSLE